MLTVLDSSIELAKLVPAAAVRPVTRSNFFRKTFLNLIFCMYKLKISSINLSYKWRQKNGLDTRVFFYEILHPRGDSLNKPGGLPYSARGTCCIIVSTHSNLPKTFQFNLANSVYLRWQLILKKMACKNININISAAILIIKKYY